MAGLWGVSVGMGGLVCAQSDSTSLITLTDYNDNSNSQAGYHQGSVGRRENTVRDLPTTQL